MLKIKKPSKIVLITSIVGILVAVGTGLYYYRHKTVNNAPANQTSNQEGEINLDPPTAADAKRVDENKQAIVDKEIQQAQTTPSDTKKSVTPVITYAGQYGTKIEVGGGINGIFEEGGICTATYKNGTKNFNKTSIAVMNMNAVDCPAIEVNTTEFIPKGIWEVTLSYASPAASGVSQPKQLEVK